MALTGTLFGGTAGSLFYLLYRRVPELHRLYTYEDKTRWVDHYSLWEREWDQSEPIKAGVGASTGIERWNYCQEVHLCVPPDFKDWIESLGMPVTPIGPELRSTGKASPSAALPTPEQRRQMAEASIAGQFEKIMLAAQSCDVIVGATAFQIAAPSVAEKLGIPYVFVAYCPAVLPSPHHAPPVLGLLGDTPAPTPADYAKLWALDAERFNMFGPALNSHRASLGLSPVSDVRSHIFTDLPWLAADPILAPWPDPADEAVFQSGALIQLDERSLSPQLEAFLDAGEPPVYFGFGSNRAPEDISQVIVHTARALGRRAIISQGWAELSVVDNDPDCPSPIHRRHSAHRWRTGRRPIINDVVLKPTQFSRLTLQDEG